MDLAMNREKELRGGGVFAASVRVYLLDRDFCVISGYTCEGNGENGVVGSSFFDLVPAKRAVREEVADYVRSFPHKMLLTLCGRTPVLFVGTLTAHTGLVLAVLPQGDIRSVLAFPAAFHGVLAHVCVSPSAQMRYKAHADEAFAEACRWLASISAPFAGSLEAERSLAGALDFISGRLSLLMDLPLSCDFMGVSALSCAKVDMPFATGVILAALAAAKRAEAADGVHAYAAMEGVPTLYLEYKRRKNADTVCEFLPLLRCAASRGVSLDVVSPVSDPCRVQVRACLGIVELSAQGVRERHRFLEGKSPLVVLSQAAAEALPFPEFVLD